MASRWVSSPRVGRLESALARHSGISFLGERDLELGNRTAWLTGKPLPSNHEGLGYPRTDVDTYGDRKECIQFPRTCPRSCQNIRYTRPRSVHIRILFVNLHRVLGRKAKQNTGTRLTLRTTRTDAQIGFIIETEPATTSKAPPYCSTPAMKALSFGATFLEILPFCLLSIFWRSSISCCDRVVASNKAVSSAERSSKNFWIASWHSSSIVELYTIC